MIIIKDTSKAMALKGQDRRDLRTLLRLLNISSKAVSTYTKAELRAHARHYEFFTKGIL